MELLDDAEIRAAADELRERVREGGESLDDVLPEAFALCREASKRTLGQRHYDVQMIGGMVLHSGSIAEMKTGEGKTLTATLAVFLNTLGGDSVHIVTVNDYLARRDAEWMQPLYERPRGRGRRPPGQRPPRPRRPPPCRLRRRRHLRHQLRVRLRLPARQHGAEHRPLLPARSPLRDRRRGRQHPHRRGADPADHLRLARGGGGSLLHVRPTREDPRGRRVEAEAEGARRVEGHVRGRVRLRVRREAQDRRPDRARGREGGEVPRRREPLPLRARHARQPPDPVAEGPVALPPRQGLRGGRRRGDDHRRAHRPDPRGAPLVGGPAPGGRGQGGAGDPRGEPDARDGHAPELLPDVREAQRHDRHRPDRGDRVHEDLQDARGRGPDEPRHGPRRRQRSDLQDQGRQVEGRRQRDRRAPRDRSADPRRHRLGRGLRDALRAVQAPRHRPRGAEREARVRAARGRDRRSGRTARRGHDRDQHGRPRRRHQARRRSRDAGRGRAPQARRQARRRELRGGAEGADARARGTLQGRGREGHRGRRAVHLRHRAPRVAPDRQPAPRPRRPPGRSRRLPVLPLRPGRPRPPLRRRPDLQDPRPPRSDRRRGRGVPARGEDAEQADRERPEEGRGAELPEPEARPRVRRRHERATPGRLQVPPRGPRGPRHGRRGPRAARRRRRRARSTSTPPPTSSRSGTSTGSRPSSGRSGPCRSTSTSSTRRPRAASR